MNPVNKVIGIIFLCSLALGLASAFHEGFRPIPVREIADRVAADDLWIIAGLLNLIPMIILGLYVVEELLSNTFFHEGKETGQ